MKYLQFLSKCISQFYGGLIIEVLLLESTVATFEKNSLLITISLNLK